VKASGGDDPGGPFSIQLEPGTLIVSGVLSRRNATRLVATVHVSFTRGEAIVLDVRNVHHVDPSVISVLIRLKAWAGGQHNSLTVRDPPPRFSELLRLTGLHRMFNVEASVPSAATSHQAAERSTPSSSGAAEPGFAVRVQDAVIVAEGELDRTVSARLLDVAEANFMPGEALVIDLSGVHYLDSSGIGALLTLRARAGNTRGSATLRHPHPYVMGLLNLVSVTELFTIEPSGNVTYAPC
jgi:anti-anti-sigma factor